MTLQSILDRVPAPLDPNAFPKICGNCMKIYHNDINFLQETTPAQNISSYIKVITGSEEGRNGVYLEVFRNCSCGSTLMELFHCRRDLSEKGIRKRAVFEVFLDTLKKNGYDNEKARDLILEFMRLSSEKTP